MGRSRPNFSPKLEPIHRTVGIVTFPLCYSNGSKSSGSIMLAVKTNVTWSLRACPISKSVRFSSVSNFRVAIKILFYHNSIAKFLFRFYFCVPFSSIKSYNNSCKVFSRSEQETGKRKHKEPSIKSAKQKNFIAYTDFDTIRHHPNSPVLP